MDKWMKEFHWLNFADGKAFYHYCQLSNPLSAYSAGVSCFKKSNFTDHEGNSAHLNVEKAFHAKKIQSLIKLAVMKTPETMVQTETIPQNFKNLRRAIAFLASENISPLKSKSLLRMLEKCGICLSQSYRDKHAAGHL